MELCFQDVCKHKPCHIEKHCYAFSIHFSFFTYYIIKVSHPLYGGLI